MTIFSRPIYNDIELSSVTLPSPDVVATLFRHLTDELSLSHIHFVSMTLGTYQPTYLASTYPRNWLSRLDNANFVSSDPLRKKLFETKSLTVWTFVDCKTEAETAIMDTRAREVGTKGCSLPIISSGGRISSLSLVCDDNNSDWLHNLSQSLMSVKKIGLALHAGIVKQYGYELDDINLSTRHLDCLKLLASGMNEKEISKILSISEKSVKNYIMDIKDKLNARNKVQIIARAFEAGILDR